MKSGMSTYRLFALLLAGLIMAAPDARAVCSDGRHPTVLSEFTASDFVVSATVVGSHIHAVPNDSDELSTTTYLLRIDASYKGAHQSEITVTSENSSGAFPMTVGKQYLVFIKTYDGLNIVDPCGNSGLGESKEAAINAIRHEVR
jgi:hypothetical protein